MFECGCLDKTDKILLTESISGEINGIVKHESKHKMGRLDSLGELLREVIATKECSRTDYHLQKGIKKLGWK